MDLTDVKKGFREVSNGTSRDGTPRLIKEELWDEAKEIDFGGAAFNHQR